MSIINEYMKNNRLPDCEWMARRLECNDGFTMSVQGSHFAYSTPRKNDADYYSTVEVGFPSTKPESFFSYAENENSPMDTVYGYVPVELVEREIELHGGLKGPAAYTEK